MWTSEQRQRLAVEHQILQREGFDQFSVYHYPSGDTYSASGIASSSSGRHYHLYLPIPPRYPFQRPPLYVTDPDPLRLFNGSPVASLGVSHAMHTLMPHATGWPQICHWRDERWHSNILLQKVFLKAHIWLEAYEQHLATGRSLADFVPTMAGTV